MGQYYYVVNLDKNEKLHPRAFDDGLKLMEFGQSRGGTLTGLAVLLAVGNGRGGGDIRSDDPLVGSWAGDRIAVIGDYAENDEIHNVANACEVRANATDISHRVVALLREAGELRGPRQADPRDEQIRDLTMRLKVFEDALKKGGL